MKGSFLVSNTARSVNEQQWAWQMMVDAGKYTQLLAKVVLRLHPTFSPNRIEISASQASNDVFKSPIFQGWGTFKVGVDLYWSASTVITSLEHQLVFSNGGVGALIDVNVPSDAIPKPVHERQEPQLSREELQRQLVHSPFLSFDDPRFFHGRLFKGDLSEPRHAWSSRLNPRDDHTAPEWLTATEFEDHEAVLDTKCAQLAQMILLSRNTVVYSGAGISVASCIGQAARGSGSDKSRGLDAWPSKTHYALGALGRNGLIHGWVQQNHDGLPQKAGFPQEKINEIHGSWFDPANPVVLYSGSLKSDAYPRMRHDADTADLVIVVGTSLGGLNADQVAIKTAKRSLKPGGALGTVMINLQQTEEDGKASLRLFSTTDSALSRVLEKLGLAEVSQCRCGGKFCRERNGYMYRTAETASSDTHWWDLSLMDEAGKMRKVERPVFAPDRVAIVPYDRHGRLSQTARMTLDLRDGQPVKLTDDHNIQGAGQPQFLHIGATEPYNRPAAYGGQMMVNGPGRGVVQSYRKDFSAFMLVIEGVSMVLGVWWIEAARRGQLEKLPVININPLMNPMIECE